jgi:hypothetical protein
VSAAAQSAASPASPSSTVPVVEAVASLGQSSVGRRWLALYLLGLASALPVYLLFATPRFTLLSRAIAWLGLGLALLPLLRLLASPGARRCTVVAIGLWVTLYHHLAVFHERVLLVRWGEARLSERAIEISVLLAALAVPAMWLGWATGAVWSSSRWLPKPRLAVSPTLLRGVGTAIVLLSLLADVLWLRGELSNERTAVSVIAWLTPGELGFAMVLLPTLSSEHRRGLGRYLFWGLFALAATVALMRGVLTPLIKPLLIYLLGWLFVRRQLRLWPVITALLAIVILQPVKAEFRARVWDRSTRMELWQRAQLFLDLTAQHWLGEGPGLSQDKSQSLQVAAARTAGALQLAHAIEMTPAAVPHQWGATYVYLRHAFIPRVFDPEKPIAQWADVWAAVIYGYTTPAGTAHVMVGLGQLPESYINFGFFGALVLWAFVGLLCRFVDDIFAHPQAQLGALVLHLYFVQNLTTTLEGSLAQFWGGVPQTFLFYGTALAVLGSLTARRSRTGSPMTQGA